MAREEAASVREAYQKIRKRVYKIADTTDLPEDDKRIVRFLMSLSRSGMPFKKKRRILFSLQ
jgi:hypothetical protein